MKYYIHLILQLQDSLCNWLIFIYKRLESYWVFIPFHFFFHSLLRSSKIWKLMRLEYIPKAESNYHACISCISEYFLIYILYNVEGFSPEYVLSSMMVWRNALLMIWGCLWPNHHSWWQKALRRAGLLVCCVCSFLDFAGMAEVVKMKVRVELMVVKGPSVYLVLVNMKYNPPPPPRGSRSSAHLRKPDSCVATAADHWEI